MLLLVNAAHSAEQVTAAMALLRWDKMVRARQQQRYASFTPHATRALLKVSIKHNAWLMVCCIQCEGFTRTQ